MKNKKLLVTGGLGFIGSCFVEMALERGYSVVNVDKMTYAARKDLDFDKTAKANKTSYEFTKKDICDLESLPADASFIVNFAAESHVDNSIRDSDSFMKSNVLGVRNLLELVRKAAPENRPVFIQISTDEVYGDILKGSFKETDALKPSNPYSATKAAAEQIVMGWGRTHGLKYRITRSSNNYGPGQSDEKFIPNIMKHARAGEKAKVYGKGINSREWTHTRDNCAAIFTVMDKGSDSGIYNISSGEELNNLEVVKKVLKAVGKQEDFFEFVADRPGHDVRYCIDSGKIRALGWKPEITLDGYLSKLS